MSGNQVSAPPTHRQPRSEPRPALTPGPSRASTLPTASSAPALAVPPSLSRIPPPPPSLPVSRTSAPTTTAHEGVSAAIRESSSVASTDNDTTLPPRYPRLARKMGEMPEVAIFRRFGALNAQNLLYMQAELVGLEKRLHEIQARDAAAPSPRSKYAVNWFWLQNSEDQGKGDEDDQWELVKKIRMKLKEYNKMIIQAHASSQKQAEVPESRRNWRRTGC